MEPLVLVRIHGRRDLTSHSWRPNLGSALISEAVPACDIEFGSTTRQMHQGEEYDMRIKLLIIVFAVSSLFIVRSQAQTADSGFSKGELSTAKNHTGNIWLNELNVGDSAFDPSIAMATYDAGAKLDWHSHPGGQVLLITEGTGYYQERGKPARIVHKGDVIKCAPGVEHWHGATPSSTFAYIAVTPTQKGKQSGWSPLATRTITA
jgi:quercetin dioxygenase-like cupin family protein